MSIEIKNIRKKDFITISNLLLNPVLSFLLNPYRKLPLDKILLYQELYQESLTFVILEKQKLVGFYSILELKNAYRLQNLFIEKSYRRKRIARNLIKTLSIQIKNLEVLIHHNQRETIALIESCGFEKKNSKNHIFIFDNESETFNFYAKN